MTANITDHLLESGLATSQHVPEKHTLFSLGDHCNHYVIVQHGTVRVELLSSTGQQLLLYRINAGESCAMTTSCLLGNVQYFAQAISETPVELILLSKTVFNQQLSTSKDFQAFVFRGFHERFSHLMSRTAELATRTIDQRLAAALLAYLDVTPSGVIEVTHQQLAVDIGSAREVVSRRLAFFETRGIVRRQRGAIDIQNKARLQALLQP